MKKILGKLPDHVTYVPVDFEKQNLGIALKKAGYDLNSKPFLSWKELPSIFQKKLMIIL